MDNHIGDRRESAGRAARYLGGLALAVTAVSLAACGTDEPDPQAAEVVIPNFPLAVAARAGAEASATSTASSSAAQSLTPALPQSTVQPAPSAVPEAPSTTPASGTNAPESRSQSPAPAGSTATTTTAVVSGVPIGVGESWQAKVNANPAGTTYLVRGGVHAGQSVVPKNGDKFIGDPGAVMDGQNSVQYAISGSASNVTIRGLEVRSYKSPLQHGAIEAISGTGWLIESVNVHDNFGGGVSLGSNSTLRNSRVHHNGQIGLKSWKTTGAVFDNVEVDHNNTNHNDPGWEAGGTKFSETTNLTVRNSYVHDNIGPGLWTDTDNYGTLYEGNRVENNTEAGIFHEISYDAVIRNNTVTGNGLNYHSWLWGAGIQIAASGSPSGTLEIAGNTVSGNGNGIALLQQNRGSGPRGAYLVQNVYVHDNTVIASGITGAAQDIGDNAIFTSRNNRFQGNRYQGKNHWTWSNSDIPSGLSFAGWQNHGQDTTSSD